MTGTAAPRMRGGPLPSALPHGSMTDVELTWIEKKIEYWIRFGRQAHEQILDRRRRVVGFQPNAVFAFVAACAAPSAEGDRPSSLWPEVIAR